MPNLPYEIFVEASPLPRVNLAASGQSMPIFSTSVLTIHTFEELLSIHFSWLGMAFFLLYALRN